MQSVPLVLRWLSGGRCQGVGMVVTAEERHTCAFFSAVPRACAAVRCGGERKVCVGLSVAKARTEDVV